MVQPPANQNRPGLQEPSVAAGAVSRYQSEELLTALLFIILLFIGLFIFDDFGLGWDEPQQRKLGNMVWDFLVHGDRAYYQFVDRDYGVFFELFLVWIEKIFSLTDSRAIYLSRHLATHLFYLLGALFFYLLAKDIFKEKWLPFLALLFFILQPRIYAHSFFNSKDIPFLVLLVISLYTLNKVLMMKGYGRILIHAVCCGLLVNIRILGVLMVVVTILFLGLELIKPDTKSRVVKQLLLFITITCATLVASWPYLWEAPLGNLINAFNNMKNFRYEGIVLYFGDLFNVRQLPWHYSLVWILISTPVSITVLFLVGLPLLLTGFSKNIKSFLDDHQAKMLIIAAICFLSPISAVILFKSVLYNDWRHLYFVYPCMVLLAVYGLSQIISAFRQKKSAAKLGGVIILATSLAFTALSMVTLHPHQYLYFNHLLPRSDDLLKENWTLDYFGLSYRSALEYIVNQNEKPVKVYSDSFPGRANRAILKLADRQKLQYVDRLEDANYFATTKQPMLQDNLSAGVEVFSLKIQQSRIVSVYDLTVFKR